MPLPEGPTSGGRAGLDHGVERVEDGAPAAGEADIAKLEQHGRDLPTEGPQERSRARAAGLDEVRGLEQSG